MSPCPGDRDVEPPLAAFVVDRPEPVHHALGPGSTERFVNAVGVLDTNRDDTQGPVRTTPGMPGDDFDYLDNLVRDRVLLADPARPERHQDVGKAVRAGHAGEGRQCPVVQAGLGIGECDERLILGPVVPSEGPGADGSTAELAASYWRAYDERMASTSFLAMAREFPRIVARAVRLGSDASCRDLVTTIGLNVVSGVFTGYALLATTGVLQALFAAGPTPHRVRAAIPSLALA